MIKDIGRKILLVVLTPIFMGLEYAMGGLDYPGEQW